MRIKSQVEKIRCMTIKDRDREATTPINLVNECISTT
jgi:hypothetical protein